MKYTVKAALAVDSYSIWVILDHFGKIQKILILLAHSEYYIHTYAFGPVIIGDWLWNFDHLIYGAEGGLDPAFLTLQVLPPRLRSQPQGKWSEFIKLL